MTKLIILLVIFGNLFGCTTVSPLNGHIYSEVTAGLTGKGKMGTKKGESCLKSVAGVAIGDVSIAKAAKDGGISKISHVDNKFRNILGVYTEYCTIVYGF